jgi:tetratricopeptide (TPR) repeat protein
MPDKDQAAIATARDLIRQHRAGEALDVLAPVITDFDGQVAAAKAKGMVFCAADFTEALLYSGMSAKKKKAGIVLGREVCEAYFLEAFALTDLDRKDEALAALERLTALSPMHAHYFVELGFAYRASGNPAKAREAYQHAHDVAGLSGDDAQAKLLRAAALRGLGYIAIDQGDLDEAEKLYRKSLEDDPDSAIAKSELEFIASKRAEQRQPAA